jgi:Fe-S-cluster containining protein
MQRSTRDRHRRGPARPGSIESDDRRLLESLDRDSLDAAERSGPWLLCKPGCDDCCHGPFPISTLDVRRLKQGLAELGRREPAVARRIAVRAAAAVRRLTPGFPGDPQSGDLIQDEQELDRFFEGHQALACPALGPESGRCELYAWRPVACRTFGPPLRFGEERADPCKLCFDGADAAEIERCRIEPDVEGLEGSILDRIGPNGGKLWETLIAFALASPDG